MRQLRRTWPAASALFVALGLGIAWAGGSGADSTATAPAAADRPTPIRIFGQTWCLGGQPAGVECDFTLPAAPQPQPTAQPAPAEADSPIARLMNRVKALLSGDQRASGPAAAATPDRG